MITPVSDGIKCEQMKVNTDALNSQAAVRSLTGWEVCYWSDVKLGRFRFQLEASHMSSLTEELWYNKTVCLLMTIYIYIYIHTIYLSRVILFAVFILKIQNSIRLLWCRLVNVLYCMLENTRVSWKVHRLLWYWPKKDTGNTKRVDRKTYIQVTETRYKWTWLNSS